MSIQLVNEDEVISGRHLRKTAIEIVDEIKELKSDVDMSKPMYCFDKLLTWSDIRYGLFTVGPFRELLPNPGVGREHAINVTIIDLDGGIYSSVIYYPQYHSKDLQIRDGLKNFFREHIHFAYLTEIQYREDIEGDIVRFFIDPNNNKRIYVKYIIRRQNTDEVKKNTEDLARKKAEEYAKKLIDLKNLTDKKLQDSIGSIPREFSVLDQGQIIMEDFNKLINENTIPMISSCIENSKRIEKLRIDLMLRKDSMTALQDKIDLLKKEFEKIKLDYDADEKKCLKCEQDVNDTKKRVHEMIDQSAQELHDKVDRWIKSGVEKIK